MNEVNNLKTILELAIALGFFIRLTWQMSEMKSAIYTAIDKVRDELDYRFNQLEKRFEIHLNDYERSADMMTLICNQLREASEHKYKRLSLSLRDIEKFLQRDRAYKVREHFGEDSGKLDE